MQKEGLQVGCATVDEHCCMIVSNFFDLVYRVVSRTCATCALCSPIWPLLPHFPAGNLLQYV